MPHETATSIAKRLSAVTAKRASVAVGLWGEPGVGKTFTVQRALREITCRNASVHATASNRALLHALPRPKNLPGWAERLTDSLEHGGHVETKAMTDALAAWLVALAPFVMSVEDLHEAPPERRALFTDLATAIHRTRGVGLIVTSRTRPPEPFAPVHLEPLGEQEARSLLESEAGSALPGAAVSWIETHARGNPLFTHEYFRHLTRLGNLWSDGQRWRWREPEREAMPTSVEAVIGHHLRAVGAAGAIHDALAVKAMLPLDADEHLWMEVAGLELEAWRAARDSLEQGGILLGDAFVHPLYREVTRAGLPPDERRDIARRLIAVLSERDLIAAAAFVTDANLNADEARVLLERAAGAARQGGDPGQVARLLMQVSTLIEGPERVGTMLDAAKHAREVNLSDALEMAQAALAEDPDHLEVNLLTAELLAGLGRGEAAQRLLARPLERYGSGPSAEALCIFATRVRVKHLSHDYAGVLELWHERTARHPRERPGIGTAVIARACLQLWRLEEAETLIARALEAPRLSNLEQAELRYIRSIIPYYTGDYARAEHAYNQFLRTLDAIADASPRFTELRAGSLQLRAYIRNVLGRPRAAVEDITLALELSARFGNAGYYAHVQSELGLYLLECSEYRRAEEVILEARATLERVGNAIYLSVVERIAARLYLEWAPPHGAALSLKHARAALAHIERANRPPFYMDGALFIAAWAEALHGRVEEALGLAAELEALSSTVGQAGVVAGAAWVRGLALERSGQPTPARQALEAAIAAGIPMQLGPTLERMGLELDRLSGDLESARRRAEGFRASGALGAFCVAQRYFPELQERPEPNKAPIELATARLGVLGQTQVTSNGVLLSYRTRKGKELLATLCEARIAGRPEVSDLMLFDALYPDLPELQAGNALKQLVYRLRIALGQNAILRSNEGYRLGAVETDAEQFLATGQTRHWRGPYLADLGENYASSAREALYYALHKRAVELLPSDPVETARLGRILLEANPFELETLELTLQALRAGGDGPGEARLRTWAMKQFEEVGEALPTLSGSRFESRPAAR